MTPQITLTIPNGKITGAKLYLSGTALISLDIDFNGVAKESVFENGIYSWSWSDKDGSESLSIQWVNNFSSRFIHKIELTYTPDLGGKLESGLSFSAKEYEAILGENFSSPTLRNPNKLDVSWSSSNDAVATVDDKGKVTLEGRGKVTITASTAGNDEYAAGNAKYELNVIPSASNITELVEYAPGLYDRVKVNFPATVTFAQYSIAFVTDSEGKAACFDDIRNRNSTSTTPTTIYSVGQVIPAGWIASNATMYESVIWEGLPDKSTETVEVTYPKVNSVTPADADRVVILKNVTFKTQTAEGNSKAFGTTPDGTSYEFQNTYDTSSRSAGTYDVTCVVRYSKRGSTEYFFLAPIAYSEPSDPSVVVEGLNADKPASFFDLQGNRIATPDNGIYIKVTDGKTQKIIVK
ncbi:MAG: Ig-like domain-containing protein [Muribaculaceae bacterium]|nr:Ig-like domain-containing protein [Muribaculaceae bacterium]